MQFLAKMLPNNRFASPTLRFMPPVWKILNPPLLNSMKIQKGILYCLLRKVFKLQLVLSFTPWKLTTHRSLIMDLCSIKVWKIFFACSVLHGRRNILDNKLDCNGMAPSSIVLLSNQLPTFTKPTWMTHLGHVQITQLNYRKVDISSSLTQMFRQLLQTHNMAGIRYICYSLQG